MKAAGGIEVNLVVGGASLEEYKGPSENGAKEHAATLTEYVEAPLDSTFAVRIVLPACPTLGPKDGIIVRVFLDGKKANSRARYKSHFGSVPHILVFEGIDYMTPRGRELERFKFAQLQTNEGPVAANTKPEQFKDLGTIAITCTWCRKVSVRDAALRQPSELAIGTSIPEKSLKGRAISSQAGVAKPEPVAGTFQIHTLAYPHGKDPFATFEFNYRSRKDLQIEGIIEKDPEPVALEDRDPASLSAEEVGQLQKKLQAQLQAVRADLAKIKQEK